MLHALVEHRKNNEDLTHVLAFQGLSIIQLTGQSNLEVKQGH